MKKVDISIKYGADAIMDLSTGKDTDHLRRLIIKRTKVPSGQYPYTKPL